MILMLTWSGRSKYMSLLCYDIDVDPVRKKYMSLLCYDIDADPVRKKYLSLLCYVFMLTRSGRSICLCYVML